MSLGVSVFTDEAAFKVYDEIWAMYNHGASQAEVLKRLSVGHATFSRIVSAGKWSLLPPDARPTPPYVSGRQARWVKSKFGCDISIETPQPQEKQKTAKARHFSVSLSEELADYVMIMSTALGMNSAQFLEMVTRMHRAKYEDKYQWLREVRGLGPEGGDQE